jgi:hypothetical protein
MTTLAQLRKAALAQPEVEEGTHFGMAAFLVGGKGFISMTKDGHVQLSLPEADVEAALAMCPSGEPVVRNGTPIGFKAPLADVNGKDLNDLVRRAWAHRAPKRLVKAAADQPAGDLPAIGRPATRALAGAGITTLDQVATRTQAELLALHGVGPKTIRVLAEALDRKGQSWR